MKCAAERVVIRRFAHPDLAAPLRRVTQQRFGLTIALTLVFPDDQTREQLRQREVVAAEAAGVPRQRLACEHERRAHHLPWRLTREHPPSSTEVGPRAQPNMRRTSWGRDRAERTRIQWLEQLGDDLLGSLAEIDFSDVAMMTGLVLDRAVNPKFARAVNGSGGHHDHLAGTHPSDELESEHR